MEYCFYLKSDTQSDLSKRVQCHGEFAAHHLGQMVPGWLSTSEQECYFTVCIEHIKSAQYPHDQRRHFAPSLFCFRFGMFPSVISRMDISNVISALWIITIDHVCHLVGCFKELFTGFSTLKQGKSTNRQ